MPSTKHAMIEDNRERYINPYTDFGFKKLFGTEMNKDLLISFLSMKTYRDINNAIATAQRDSKAEGKAEQNLENARKMKELNVGIGIIMQVTGLNPEQIEKL